MDKHFSRKADQCGVLKQVSTASSVTTFSSEKEQPNGGDKDTLSMWQSDLPAPRSRDQRPFHNWGALSWSIMFGSSMVSWCQHRWDVGAGAPFSPHTPGDTTDIYIK